MLIFINKLKLSTKILSIISIIMLLSLFIINIFFINSFNKTVLNKEKEKGREIAKMFAQLSTAALSRQDYYSLENNVIQLQRNQDILYAKVYDSNGLHLTPSSKEISLDKRDFLKLEEAIIQGNKSVGKVEIAIDLSDSIHQAKQYKIKMLFSSLAVTLLVLYLLYFLIRIIILKPIIKLKNRVSEISQGNLQQEVLVYAKDEIGLLFQDFNQMSKRLKENIALTQSILESMPSILITLDENYRIIKWNTQLTRFFKPTDSDLSTRVLWEVIPFFYKYREICQEVLRSSNPIRLHREAYNERVDQFFELFLYPLTIDNQKGLVLRLDDVSESEKKDAQLRQAQKMETVGTLAGGLAHDFNNVLCGIIGTISLFKHKLNKSGSFSFEDIKHYIETLEDASNRAEDMVQQFLTLSRKHELHFSKIDLNHSIKHVSVICNNTFDKSVKIETQYYHEAALTVADLTQIEQVLLNLSINGYHAMTLMKTEQNGGILKLSVDLIKSDKYLCKTHPEALEVNYWKLTVSDTGVGIPKANLNMIFDPFFTTKEKGQGTGLGLTMVYNIVKQHNGFIDIYSEEGMGTNFIIYLPHMSLDNSISLLKEEETIYKGHREKILIVDDEPMILQIAKQILEECNYEVLSASDGFEALVIYKEHYAGISLVILDMLMPRKAGRETYIELKNINPDIKVILCSGFKKDERITSLMELGVTEFIQKPYTLHKLSQLVNDVIKRKNKK